jgi:hypothetical protein
LLFTDPCLHRMNYTYHTAQTSHGILQREDGPSRCFVGHLRRRCCLGLNLH